MKKKTPEAVLETNRLWRQKNQVYLQKWQRIYNRRRAKERKALIRSYKNRPCVDCYIQFAPCAMDFHHVRGVKKFSVGYALRYSLKATLAEIAKCDVVCANCHRIRTYGSK